MGSLNGDVSSWHQGTTNASWLIWDSKAVLWVLVAFALFRGAEHSKEKHEHREALRVSASARLTSEEKTRRAGPKLLMGVLGSDGHQGTAILGTSSLTCGGSGDFINSRGSEGGDVPGNLRQPCGKRRMMSACFTLNLA